MENTNWMVLLEQTQVQKVMETNQYTERFGLMLSEQDAQLLALERKNTLAEQKRIEFGESILPGIIYEFCDSAYIDQGNYVESLIRLQEIFFQYKNEMLDEISDGELLHFMKEQFETICFGDFDYLEEPVWTSLRRLSEPATAVTAGQTGGASTRSLTRWSAGTKSCIWRHCANCAGDSADICGQKGFLMDSGGKRMYDMNDLVPIVAMLTEKYTGNDSSSVTYEKANQLMEAVVYCIREVQNGGEGILVSQQQSAMQAYRTGVQLVRRKTEELLVFYEHRKSRFCPYGNVYLADILQKGIPAFFRTYDEVFEPQNTILTLDYPILVDVSQYQGIDCVDLYVRNLAQEQLFLAKFGEDYVRTVLRAYCDDYEELPENISGIVFGNVIGHVLAGRKPAERLSETDLQGIYEQYVSCESERSGGFREKVSSAAKAFLRQHYAGEEQMQQYMTAGLTDLCARIEHAAACRKLDRIFVS